MSKESGTWLNTRVLVGNTEARGMAWHYRKDLQGTESNHYTGAIPVADVARRLFNFRAVSRPVQVTIPSDILTATGMDAEGMPVRVIEVPNTQAIVADDDGTVFGIFAGGYQIHDYETWLLEEVARIIGGELGVSSAGLLANRGIAWVEVSVPETVRGPAGIEFRPNLLACTSHTGKLASTYKRTITNTVCDNTMGMALSEVGQQFKVKHSSRSLGRLTDVREALAMVHQAADEFQATAAALVARKISRLEFKTVISALVPVTDDMSANARTIGTRKREAISALYTSDPRVAPWTGTAYGVAQAFNTWEHHLKSVKGAAGHENAARAERNMLSALTDATEKADAAVMAVLAGI